MILTVLIWNSIVCFSLILNSIQFYLKKILRFLETMVFHIVCYAIFNFFPSPLSVPNVRCSWDSMRSSLARVWVISVGSVSAFCKARWSSILGSTPHGGSSLDEQRSDEDRITLRTEGGGSWTKHNIQCEKPTFPIWKSKYFFFRKLCRILNMRKLQTIEFQISTNVTNFSTVST